MTTSLQFTGNYTAGAPYSELPVTGKQRTWTKGQIQDCTDSDSVLLLATLLFIATPSGATGGSATLAGLSDVTSFNIPANNSPTATAFSTRDTAIAAKVAAAAPVITAPLVATQSALSGTTIDITKPNLAATLSASTTYTAFVGTTPADGTSMELEFTNSAVAAITVTLPSVYSQAQQTTGVFTFTIQPTQKLFLTLKWVSGTINMFGDQVPATVVYTYSTPGTFTYTKNPAAVRIKVRRWGAGGGGGGGGRTASGTANSGGGGGGGARYVEEEYAAADVPSSLSITIPAGGVGGAGATTDGTSGTAGTAGGSTTFGSFNPAYGGGGGSGGASSLLNSACGSGAGVSQAGFTGAINTTTNGLQGSTGATAGAASASVSLIGAASGGGGNTAGNVGSQGGDTYYAQGATGGASGGSVNTVPTASAGGNGARWMNTGGPSGGAATGAPGTAGTLPYPNSPLTGPGASGGGGNAAGAGGAGGAGIRGGGGAGGGGAVGGNGGNGGAGGAGYCEVTESF